MDRAVLTRPKPKRSVLRDFDGGKPCPTCYAQMTKHVSSGGYTCPKHGKPTRP